ncbi:hypothetical protein DSO57_1014621 [Entomophthora muscae]|uniref:Uncharacterized protein n=1 Tax=Entomophthora muscae TaxID=34485 RepID=A0ACC2UR20_9FUNG|nr:hypothetical protein DSO57_1014621 [Entomophthora muscae]
MMTLYPIVTALTGFQVANLVPYLAKILPQLLGLYIKKTKILLAKFGLAWSADKTGVPAAMELTFSKTKHEKKFSTVYNKLYKFMEAFAGQRLYLVVYMGFLFYFGMWANVEDLERVLLGIDKARLSLDEKMVPLGYNLVDHVIWDALVLAGIYGSAALPESCCFTLT